MSERSRDELQDFLAHLPVPKFDMEPLDYLMRLGVDFDVEAQLRAIRYQLRHHKRADEETRVEVEQLQNEAREWDDGNGRYPDERWIDRLHDATYEDAARSMAALGMLAPLLESIFHQSFLGIGGKFFQNVPTTLERWQIMGSEFWNCHKCVDGDEIKDDIARGIIQLAKFTDLVGHLPADIKPTLQALFAYRNKMFHLGLEWPEQDREKFAARIQNEGWPASWFPKATIGDKPWVFYMSDEFIEHCIKTIEQVIEGIGAYVCEKSSASSEVVKDGHS